MEAVAALVTPGSVLADVGTDHGYVPIALVQRKRIGHAVAMDLREGPLARARENIVRFGLADQIETRLSDGVDALSPGEVDTIVVAGMGGELVIRILDRGKDVCRRAGELILQPQSGIEKVRRYLAGNGYQITDENMIYEDGKYYPMMRVRASVPEKNTVNAKNHCIYDMPPAELAELYGPCLLEMGHPVLMQYLQEEQAQLLAVENRLKQQPATEKLQKRMREIAEKRHNSQAAWEYMEGDHESI